MLLSKITSYHFHPVVQFDAGKEKIVQFDFTEKNKELQNVNLDDTKDFCKYINDLLQNASAKFGIGGYDELRTFYKRSKIFNANLSENVAEDEEEPRRLHLGVDIWGREGTEIFAPCDGIVHSFAFNDNFGDYGATIILKHTLKDVSFLPYTDI